MAPHIKLPPQHSGQPVEMIWALGPDKAVRIQEFPGYDLTFPPDPRYLSAEGRPRRLEWIDDPTVVRRLLDPGYVYNRGGQPPMFRLAEDLLRAERDGMFRAQVQTALGDAFPTREQVDALVTKSATALGRRVTDNEMAVKTVLVAIKPLRAALDDAVKRIVALEEAATKPEDKPGGEDARA